MEKFTVLRRHDGDKEYYQGDERVASRGDVQHLVDLGVLTPAGPVTDQSAAEPVEAKVEPPVTDNSAVEPVETKVEPPLANKLGLKNADKAED